MPINISKDGTGFKIEPHNTSTPPGTEVNFSVSVQDGARVCFSDPDIWDPPAPSFDLKHGDHKRKTSTQPQCTGFKATDYGGPCPTVSGCTTIDDPATISTSSIPGSEHGQAHYGRK